MSREDIIKAYEEKKSVVDFYPHSIDVEVTTFCNFECRMCPHAIIKNTVAKHMDLRILNSLEPWIKHVKKVSLQGDGEPFLNPDLDKIISFFQKFNVRLFTTTNLSVFDEEKAKLVQDFDTITISCDGCEKEIYEGIRKNGNFESFCKNIILFMNLVKRPNIIVNCVMMKQNISYAEKMVEFVNGYGIKNLVFSSLLTDSDLKNTEDSIEDCGEFVSKHIRAAQKKAKNLGVNLVIGWDMDDNKNEKPVVKEQRLCNQYPMFNKAEISHFVERYKKSKTIVQDKKYPAGKYLCKGICSNLYEKTYIDVDGNITMCCFAKTNPVGNILVDSFEEIWNGATYIGCRSDFFSGRLPDFCIGCKYALSVHNGVKQPYDFKIINYDADFIKNETFWDNRDS